MCVLFNFVSFFYSGNSSTYFKVCVDLCKKDVKRFQFLSTNIVLELEFEVGRASKMKEERNSVVIHG